MYFYGTMHFGMDARLRLSDLNSKEFLYFLIIRTKKRTLNSFFGSVVSESEYWKHEILGLEKKARKKSKMVSKIKLT